MNPVLDWLYKIAICSLGILFPMQLYAVEKEIPAKGFTLGIQSSNAGISLESAYSIGSRVNWDKSDLIKGLGTISFGIETGPLTNKDIIIAPKVSYTMNWFISFGASMLYYTDFSQGSLRFRPEIGVSMLGIRVYHGWNFSVDKYVSLPLHNRFLAISYFIPM